MDWQNAEQVVRAACLAINDAAREVEDIEPIKAAVEARQGLTSLLRELARIDDTGELERIFAVVQLMAEYEQESARTQPNYLVRATAAVEQLAVARTILGWLRRPETYRKYVAAAHAAEKYLRKGLPYDRMREGLKSHIVRIENASAGSAASQDKLDLYASQRRLVLRIEELYIQLQRWVGRAGPPEPPRKAA